MRALIFLAIFASTAFADEFRREDIFLLVGSSFAPKSTVKSTFNGQDLSTSNNSDGAGVAVGIDSVYRVTQYFGGSAVINFLNYPGSGGPADSQFFVGIGPRGAVPIGDFEIWGSALVGFGLDKFGETKKSNGSTTIQMQDSSTIAFQWGPRIGVDYDLNHAVKLRLEVDYSMIKFSEGFDVYSQGKYQGSGNVSIDESYLGAMIGVAWEF